MRPKVVAVILATAFGILAAVFFVSRAFLPANSAAVNANLSASPTPATPAPDQPSFRSARPSRTARVTPDALPAAPPLEPVAVASPAVSEAPAAVNAPARVSELMALAMNDDPDSLNTIWSELSNSNQEIRQGALAALIQFGDRSVAPRLRERAGQTTDSQEKINLLAAADQLDLPPLGQKLPVSAAR